MAITTVSSHVVSVNAIQGTLIADNAITAVHIATNAVSGTLIADNAVTATHIAQNTITVTQIADDAIEAAKIADGVITTNHLNKAMISSQTEVTAVAGDFLLIGDTSDSNNLKKIPISGIVSLAATAADDIATGDAAVTIGTSSGNITLDSPADIILDADGADVFFKDAGTTFGQIRNASNNLRIQSSIQDADIVFRGDDGGSTITALTLDMSDAGAANFNAGGTFGGALDVNGNIDAGIGAADSNNYQIRVSAGTSGLSRFIAADTSDAGYIDYEHSSDSWIHRTAGAERMRIDSSGKVHIGATSGTGILNVDGGSGEGSLYVEGTHSGSAVTARLLASDGGAVFFGSSSNHDVRIQTNSTNRMIITAAGNVTIGDGASNIDVGIGNTGTVGHLGLTGSGALIHLGGDDCQVRLANTVLHHDNSGNTTTHLRNHYGATDSLAKMKFEAGYISFCTGTSFDEKMRLKGNTLYVSTDIGAHSGGSVNGNSYAHNTYAHAGVFGANSVPDGTLVVEDYDVSSGIGNTVLKLYLRDEDPATHANFINFGDGGGSVGSITHNDDGGGVTYNTTSDYRLKENVDYNWDGTTLLKQLKPAKFNFTRAPGKTIQGMLAHEVMDIVPSSVRGEKDHMMDIGTIKDSDDNIVYEGVYEHFCKTDEGQTWTKTGTEPYYQELDYSRLVPLLVKTIQELEARIATLEG